MSVTLRATIAAGFAGASDDGQSGCAAAAYVLRMEHAHKGEAEPINGFSRPCFC